MYLDKDFMDNLFFLKMFFKSEWLFLLNGELLPMQKMPNEICCSTEDAR